MKRIIAVGAGVVVLVIALLTMASNGGSASVVPGNPGWLGAISAGYTQSVGANLTMPSSFAGANLLVAVVSNDGPDSNSSETTAVLSGTSGLHWIRHAHISARQDWAAPGDTLDSAGASSAEIWTARPPADWTPSGTVREISNHAGTNDDGGVVTVAAWANGQLGDLKTLDGLNSRAEQQRMGVPSGSSIYAALFNGRVNASFTPLSGYHRVVSHRAGDDTAQAIASDNRDLPARLQTVGYTGSPAPGNYWEAAIVVVTAAQ